MTAALFLFAAAVLCAAIALSTLLWKFADEPPGAWERTASIGVLAFAIPIAISWLLSWLHLLDRTPLLVVSIVLAIPSLLVLYRRRGVLSAKTEIRNPALLGYLVPLLLWIVFALWRGAVVPVLSHDALSYHLPKAVMLAQAHEFRYFDAPDPRISTSPANYELLLADMLLLAQNDALTEWLTTASFLVLLLLAAALVERWWNDARAAVATILLTAAVPVIFLHIGAHKNDLLSNVFYLGAILWGGRFLATRERAPLALALIALAAAGGTKLQGAFVAFALLAVFAWTFVRDRFRLTRTHLLIIALSIPIALLLLGGWAYVANLTHTGQAALPASSSSDAGYGDWNNLWQVPVLMLIRPFDSSTGDVYVPWRHERWFWPRWEIYFSDYGALLSVLVLLLPFAVMRYRTMLDARQRERFLTSLAALLAFALMLPIRIRPLGFFSGFPRYFCFIAIFVLAWTVAPLVRELASKGKQTLVHLVLATSVILLCSNGAVYTWNDRFQPLSYVLAVDEKPTRMPFFANYRAALVADLVAPPDATMAIHAGFDSWIYPAYGAQLRRRVTFLKPGEPIPSDVDFVLVDRAWNQIWGHPLFRHMGQYQQYLSKGHVTEEDQAVLRELQAHPEEWEQLFYLEERNQAVFRRRNPAPRSPRADVPSDGSSR